MAGTLALAGHPKAVVHRAVSYPQVRIWGLTNVVRQGHRCARTGPAVSSVDDMGVRMFDTYVTVVGTVLHQPDKRVTNTTNALVSTFRVATHPRRYDPKLAQWVDAPSLRIRVNCWRRLAEHVAACVATGDPVIVYGRISTREWKTETGETRVSYEMDADNVGHDLSRGMAQFTRARSGGTSVIEDEDTDSRVNGEPTSPWVG